MPTAYRGNRSQVLVATKVDGPAHPSLDAAAQLCRRTGMRLKLVNVVEISQYLGVPYSPYDMFGVAAVGRLIGDEMKEQVERNLSHLATKLDVGSPVETSVIVGAPGEAILSAAIASGCSLIVTGAGKTSHRFVPKGLSTALTLMADASVPVLVVQDDTKLDLTRPTLKLLVADDLSASGERAVHTAFDLALALGRTDLHHVHANALNMDAFSHAVLRATHLGGPVNPMSPLHRDMSPSEMWDAVQQDLRQRVKARAPGRAEQLAAVGGHYTSEVRNGAPDVEIEGAIHAADPDLLVFGRHQTVHRRPLSIGRVPFHFMLSQHRPLLVVPTR